MSETIDVNIPLNRVEGDLEVRVEIEDGRCRDAWCTGTMYRGFERILVGRGALDGLVITPRICGICSTGHLTAAARALEDLVGVTPPPRATALRNVALMAEHLQSDVRQTVLTFAVDFTNPRYRDQPLFDEAVRRYESFRGVSFVDVLRESKRLLELVAIIAGQWPHSTFAVPGGITSLPSDSDLHQGQLLLERFRQWYERQVLGSSLERWAEVDSLEALEAWLEEHPDGDVGFLLRFGRAIGLDTVGAGSGRFLSYGALELPEGTEVAAPLDGSLTLVPAGFVGDDGWRKFNQMAIAEHLDYSWFLNDGSGSHPSIEKCTPYATGGEGKAYSWAKAPRYDGEPAETGPLAEALVAKDPLFRDLVARQGASALVRQLARAVRPATMIPAMQCWLGEAMADEVAYLPPGPIEAGEGVGLTQAARGGLGHWIRLSEGRIDHYQIITPTTWNASPRDDEGRRGPMEEALVGAAVADPNDPVELGQIVRSFDPCLVCTVHTVRREGRSRTVLGVAGR